MAEFDRNQVFDLYRMNSSVSVGVFLGCGPVESPLQVQQFLLANGIAVSTSGDKPCLFPALNPYRKL